MREREWGESQQTDIIDPLHPNSQFIPVMCKSEPEDVRCAFISRGQMEQSYGGANCYLQLQVQVMALDCKIINTSTITAYVCITRTSRYVQQWYDSTLMEINSLFFVTHSYNKTLEIKESALIP